ncbi:MAG: hypothetical protein ACK2TU_00235 [Anaerolineales bacterium]|jgi:hypothetical protein
MDQEIKKNINSKVYSRFPELNGKEPTIRLQNKPDHNNSSSKTYLLIYSGKIEISGEKSLTRIVRVVAGETGNIIKISTSR